MHINIYNKHGNIKYQVNLSLLLKLISKTISPIFIMKANSEHKSKHFQLVSGKKKYCDEYIFSKGSPPDFLCN